MKAVGGLAAEGGRLSSKLMNYMKTFTVVFFIFTFFFAVLQLRGVPLSHNPSLQNLVQIPIEVRFEMMVSDETTSTRRPFSIRTTPPYHRPLRRTATPTRGNEGNVLFVDQRRNNLPETPVFIRRTTTMQYLIRPKVQEDKFVTFAGGFADGRGLGNQMFDMAAVVYLAELSGRTLAMEKVNHSQTVDEVFNLTQIPRLSDLCPCYQYTERRALVYDPQVEILGQPGHGESSSHRTIVLNGFFQSWKYTRSIESRLRRLFRFQPDIKGHADRFLEANFPPGWTQAFVRVAVHVRRGDNLNQDKMEYGYTVPNATYFQRAMEYYAQSYGRVQFIVVSTDAAWTRGNVVAPPQFDPSQVNVTYTTGNKPGQDMAIMASCDHVIMSTGTFGWWAGFLAKGSTVYYSAWPRANSMLHMAFRKEDFFPPAWIPM